MSEVMEHITPSEQCEELGRNASLAYGLLQNMADGILAVDEEGKVALFNQAAVRITQLSDKEALGKHYQEVFHCSGTKGENPLYRALKTGEVLLDHGAALATKTGERVPLSVTCTPFLNDNQEVVGAVAVFRDMSELRVVEDMKTEFVSTVSHELRTPLTSIKGSIGLILGGVAGQINEEVTELLTIAQHNTDRLIKLINEMLDVSKIESGKIQMNRGPVSLVAVVEKALEAIQTYAQECKVTLDRKGPETVSEVLADRDRIEQVITNLLSNAIKFTPPGGRVTVTIEEEAEHVQVSVTDTGIGIPEGQLEKIFDKFHQVDRAATRQKGGTGLGLSICYAIISEHDGKIWAESAEGVGSCFSFTLPKTKGKITRAAQEMDLLARMDEFRERVRPKEGVAVEGKTVLICDDDPTAVRELKSFLEREGFTCIEAFSGKEAIEIARRVKVDAVTMDIIMPGLDGFQVVNMLKEDPATEKIPIVFVSVLKDKANKEIALGVQDWLVKPVDESRVVKSIKAVIGQKKERPVILVVDDDRDTVKLVRTMVEKAGYACEAAYDGREAIERINSLRPDLIILDIMMPSLDGFQVVSLLKENKWTRDIPVLVLTAKDLTPIEKKTLHLGVTKFLTKSYASQDKIMQDVAELLYSALGH